jgi:hypothetical protein
MCLEGSPVAAQPEARLWTAESFEAALRRGTAAGSIKDLGGGLFEVGDDAPDPSEGQFDPS